MSDDIPPGSPVIRPFDAGSEYFTDELCHIVELANGTGDEAVSIARARVAPGVTTRWHRLLGTVERYVIVSGEGLVEVGKLPPQRMTVGDVAIIPALCPQRIANIGPDDLVFLAICSPRFRPDCYQALDI